MKSSNRSTSGAKPRPVTVGEPLRTPQQLRAQTRKPAPPPADAPRPAPAAKKSNEPIWVWPSLIAILLLAFLLRLYGITFGLPHLYHGGEAVQVSDAMRGFGGDFHLSASPYPALGTRFLFAVCGLPLLFGRLTGHYHSLQDFIVSCIVSPTHVLLWARLASSLLGTLGVLLTFLIGRKIFGERVGLVGALLLTASVQQGAMSHFAVPDALQSALILAAFFPLYNALTRGQRRDYVWAGLLIGLGAATGYMAALLLPFLVFAAFLRHRVRATAGAGSIENAVGSDVSFAASAAPVSEDKSELARLGQPSAYSNLFPGLLAAAGGFCLLALNTVRSPLAAYSAFKAGLASDFIGNGANGVTYTLWQALRADWGAVALVLTLAGAALVLRARKAAGLLFLSFPALYTLVLVALSAQAGRVWAGVDPFLALFASVALCRVYDAGRAALARRNKPVLAWKIAWTLLAVMVALPPLWTLLQWDSLLSNTADSRSNALKWAEQNIPPGSVVCLQTPRPAFQTSQKASRSQIENNASLLAPDRGANAPLLTEAGIARADAELSRTPFDGGRGQADDALRQRVVYRETPWTWPPPAPTLLRQSGAEYVFISDACGPLPAEWQRQMEQAARGGILHFTPGSVASSLPPGLPALPPRLTVYILRDLAHP